jgi:hypothetical protein
VERSGLVARVDEPKPFVDSRIAERQNRVADDGEEGAHAFDPETAQHHMSAVQLHLIVLPRDVLNWIAEVRKGPDGKISEGHRGRIASSSNAPRDNGH